MNITDQDIREFREAYLVSNTPIYLYKRLRRLAAVQYLADAVPGKGIAAEYLRRTKVSDRSPDDLAVAYACLVSLTYKPPREALPLFRSLDLSSLDWAPAIRDVFFAKTPSGLSHSIMITDPKIPSSRVSSIASSTSAITPAPKPSVERKANL
jgi:hypothetical protein